MNALFEQFVIVSLEERLRPPFTLHSQFPWWLDDDQQVRIKPDLVFKWHGLPSLPADCKYKRLNEGQFKHHDLYQMLSYCTALDLTRGALVYPRHESELTGEVAIRNSDIEIRFLDVDLGVTREKLPAVLDQLSENLVSWAPAPAMRVLGVA
jgi:5-methylcytosine-specific restriction enzyme subunit McrC